MLVAVTMRGIFLKNLKVVMWKQKKTAETSIAGIRELTV